MHLRVTPGGGGEKIDSGQRVVCVCQGGAVGNGSSPTWGEADCNDNLRCTVVLYTRQDHTSPFQPDNFACAWVNPFQILRLPEGSLPLHRVRR